MSARFLGGVLVLLLLVITAFLLLSTVFGLDFVIVAIISLGVLVLGFVALKLFF